MPQRLRVLVWLVLGAALLSSETSPIASPSRAFEKVRDRALLDEILQARPRPGDVVLRRGTSVTSRLVLATDRSSSYSHAGVVVRMGDALGVVHALPANAGHPVGGVLAEPLASFLEPPAAVAAALLRVRGHDQGLGERVAERARSLAAAGLPFDADFDLATPDALYCTELVRSVYLPEGIDLASGLEGGDGGRPRFGGHLLPSHLETSSYFETLRRAELGKE